ncbi:hypothetical protein OSH11_17425 [Kaistia dalseonensis]|uniref:Uncharacterized protein n=1 Tax=Kaistia dalseonensis TaxID=410840 RepID=A0ABU0H9W4_9HYPH|nr:hypothetical protein [Kaistia dalseonensis]MCX5496491.1 hypothetical protein [Kaistia dalseonensis]MDQ0439113.1 hypothetical protein [Kaistia dalseonensis]
MPHRSQRLHEIATQLATLAAESSELGQFRLADLLTAAMTEAHSATAGLGGASERTPDQGLKPSDLTAANDF